MQEKVQQMEMYLNQEYEKETRLRMNFNETHHRYLPQNLRYLIEEPHTRYTIYPKEKYLGDGLRGYEDCIEQIIENTKVIDFLEDLKKNSEGMFHQNADMHKMRHKEENEK